MSEDNAIRMQAQELEMRYQSGGRFRLVEMTYMKPSHPPQVGGRWPLITNVEQVKAWRRPPILYSTEALPGESYEAYPEDVVVVIPVHPEQASRTAQGAREAVSA